MDIGIYVEQVCKDLGETVSGCDIEVAAEHGIVIATDRAISAALIIGELATNAAKYAYRGRPGGKIWVRVARASDTHVLLSVRDEGTGLPAGFDPQSAKSLGMRIIAAFSQQLEGQVTAKAHSPGTEFVVAIPLADEPHARREQ